LIDQTILLEENGQEGLRTFQSTETIEGRV